MRYRSWLSGLVHYMQMGLYRSELSFRSQTSLSFTVQILISFTTWSINKQCWVVKNATLEEAVKA